jgi:hypothetical protein
MDAQKKLFGLAAQQMKANVKAAGRTMDTMKPMVLTCPPKISPLEM